METWLRENAKPALFEALSEAWSNLENSYQNACHAENIRVAGLDGELRVMRAQAGKADWLEQQNKTLRLELDQLRRSNQKQQQEKAGQGNIRPGARTPLAPLSPNKARNLGTPGKHVGEHMDVSSLSRDELAVEYTRLDEKYRNLRSQFTDSIDAVELLKKQCREKTQAYQKWMNHSKELEAQSHSRKLKIDKLKARLAAVTSNDAAADASFTSDTHSVADDGHDVNEQDTMDQPSVPVLWRSGVQSDSGCESPVLDGADVLERAPSLPPFPEVGSEVTRPSPTKEPSSDTPVVISERSVRKRRREGSPLDRTPVATRIKREEGSDPIMTSEQRHFMAHESVDFDNAEELVVTPRKTKTTRLASQTAPQAAKGGHSASLIGISTSLRPISPVAVASHVSMGSAHTEGREEGGSQLRETIFKDEFVGEIDQGAPVDRSSTLRADDTSVPRLVTQKKPRSKAIAPPALREGIASLAEDGNRIRPTPDMDDRYAAKGGRLAHLLNNIASPEREAISFPSLTRTQETPGSHAFLFTMPEKRELPFKRSENMISKTLRAPATPTLNSRNVGNSAARVIKTPLDISEKHRARKDKPLRERPLKSLNRADFKLNPKYNEGYNFAFGDVVRGKERASLPSCSREECCGKRFRPIAEASLPDTGHVAFTSLLEDYLGDDAGKLGSMTKEEKEKMWIDAKIRELSNQHGRHRERHAAMREPVGWDRLGFPSTQEDEEDRVEATRLELDEVELRHREAVKKGKYLFRDEDP